MMVVPMRMVVRWCGGLGLALMLGSACGDGASPPAEQAAVEQVSAAVEWAGEQKLALATPLTSDFYGTAVGVYGSRAVVTTLSGGAGRAYVYERTATGWTTTPIFTIAAPEDGDNTSTDFGTSAAIGDGVVVIGAPNYGGTGAVFAYDISEGASDPQPIQLQGFTFGEDSELGSVMALDPHSGLLVVGAPGENTQEGAAYVFQQSGSSFSPVRRLAATDPTVGERFGASVNVTDSTIAVGAPLGAGAIGRALIFTRQGNSWLTETLDSPTSTANEGWAEAVAVDDDTLVVGVPRADVGTFQDAGAVDVYRRDINEQWSYDGRIETSDPQLFGGFGWAVGLDDTRLYIGAPGENNNGNLTGAFHSYEWNPATFTFDFDLRIVPSDGQGSDFYGAAFDVHGGQLIVGAEGHDDINSNAGAAYTYATPGEQSFPCSFDGDCANGTCADGYCCDSDCAGSCERCDAAGFEGTCTVAEAGFAGSPVCESYSCDGESNECPTGCSSDSDCVTGRCQPDGSCAECVDTFTSMVAGVETPVDCSPYICGDSGGCETTCDSFRGCAEGYTCNLYESSCIELMAETPPEDEGCSCTVAKPRERAPWLLALLPLALVLRRRSEPTDGPLLDRC